MRSGRRETLSLGWAASRARQAAASGTLLDCSGAYASGRSAKVGAAGRCGRSRRRASWWRRSECWRRTTGMARRSGPPEGGLCGLERQLLDRRAGIGSGHRDRCSCEGFRMPGGREVASSAEGRRPKASKEGTRAVRAWVYGDLAITDGREGRGRWRHAGAWLAERSRQARRREWSRAPGLAEVGAIGRPGRRIDRMRV
jgi:hypothetical protein